MLEGDYVRWWGDSPVDAPMGEGANDRFRQLLYELEEGSYVDRDTTTMTHRDVLTRILETDAEHGLVGDTHLIVFVSTGYDDHSSASADALACFEQALAQSPAGVSVVLLSPLSGDCTPWPSEFDKLGHEQTADLLGPDLLLWANMCDRRQTNLDLRFLKEGVTGRRNTLDVTLEHPPLDGSLTVFGVQGDSRTALAADRFAVDGQQLTVSGPLREFDAVDVRYGYAFE